MIAHLQGEERAESYQAPRVFVVGVPIPVAFFLTLKFLKLY